MVTCHASNGGTSSHSPVFSIFGKGECFKPLAEKPAQRFTWNFNPEKMGPEVSVASWVITHNLTDIPTS